MTIFRAMLTLLLAAPVVRAEGVSVAPPEREAGVRASVESVLVLSDEDYRDRASQEETLKTYPRSTMLSLVFRRLAADRLAKAGELDASLKPRAAAELTAITPAGRTLGDDQKSAGIDPTLLEKTGWLDSFNQRFTVRTNGAAVAAVRGGRKLTSQADKEISRLLAAVDEGDKALADAAITPAKAAQIHFDAGSAYGKVSGLVLAEAAAPSAPAPAPAPAEPKAALSAKELYQKASPSVVLIMAADEGAGGELGTGSVIDSAGRVLTNAHVVINDRSGRPYGTVRVYLKPAKVTGDTKKDVRDPVVARVARFDRGLDLALLEPEKPLGAPALALGDDSAVEPGDPVIAIGHPEQGGLWTLTQGVVSAAIADLGGVPGKNAFQTDASINRGNSGGPLIDRSGDIVGVNTSMARKAADGLTITSVNFSVRSSVAKRWLDAQGDTAAASVPGAQRPGLDAQAPVAKPTAPAPAPALPPAPKTKPQILTPAQPYRIEDTLEESMKEMDDLEDEMKAEIKRRSGATR